MRDKVIEVLVLEHKRPDKANTKGGPDLDGLDPEATGNLESHLIWV